MILNTVCSLIAIRYDCTDNPPHHFDQHSVGCGFRKQLFSSISPSSTESRLDQFSSEACIPLMYLSYIVCVIIVLPLHVHKGGEELLEVCANLKDNGSVSNSILSAVDVKL